MFPLKNLAHKGLRVNTGLTVFPMSWMLFCRSLMASWMTWICMETADNTASSRRLNSSKQPHAPHFTRPTKIRLIDFTSMPWDDRKQKKYNRACCLVAVPGAPKLVPTHMVQALQLIWWQGTCWWNIQVPNRQMSCWDTTKRKGTRIVVPSNGYQRDMVFYVKKY